MLFVEVKTDVFRLLLQRFWEFYRDFDTTQLARLVIDTSRGKNLPIRRCGIPPWTEYQNANPCGAYPKFCITPPEQKRL